MEGHGKKKEKFGNLALKEAQMTIILVLGSANPLQCFSHLLPEGRKYGGSKT